MQEAEFGDGRVRRVALLKLGAMSDPAIGLVAPGSPRHAEYRDALAMATAEDFARFPGRIAAEASV